MIDVDEQFDVAALPRAVWEVLSDPHEVVGCVPGATLMAQNEDGTYDGSLTVKFGPLAVVFQARVALQLEPRAMQGQLTAHGRDKQGGTRFRGTTTFTVAEQLANGGSHVLIRGGIDLSGRLASVIESGAAVIVRRMAGEFAERLAARCAGANVP